MYNEKLLVCKLYFIPTVTDFYHTSGFLSKKTYVISFTNDDIRSIFEVFTKNKMDTLYLPERIRT